MRADSYKNEAPFREEELPARPRDSHIHRTQVYTHMYPPQVNPQIHPQVPEQVYSQVLVTGYDQHRRFSITAGSPPDPVRCTTHSAHFTSDTCHPIIRRFRIVQLASNEVHFSLRIRHVSEG